MRRLAFTFAALLFCHALIATPVYADRWSSRVERIEQDLEDGEWREVLEDSQKLRAKMLKRVDESARLLLPAARTLVLQAIAEANLGRDDDARWHWLAAQSYVDALPSLDLSRYGRAAEILGGLSADDTPQEWVSPAPEEDERYREVRVRRSPQPIYPKKLRKSGMQGQVHLEIVVDPNGQARRPRVLDGGLVPTMAFPILDAIARWQFDPAERGRQTVAVVYELRIDYR